ncbi:MAG: hypothetical protein ACOX5Q_00650 [Bacillota bacterium]|jgi:hypothetical protein
MVKRALVSCLSILMTISLVSCSSVTPPDKVVESFFAHLKATEIEQVRALLVDPGSLDSDVIDLEQNANELLDVRKLFGRMTYEVGEPKINGVKAEVPVEVTAMDLAVLMAVAMTEYLPKAFQAAFSGEELDIESEMEHFFANALDDPEAKMVTNNITIPLVKVEDQWKIDLSEDSSLEFANAVTGGLVDFLTDMAESFQFPE